MPPLNLLNKSSIFIKVPDLPLSTRNLNFAFLFREMKFWEENLGWEIWRASGGGVELEVEGCVAEVEAGGQELAVGVDWRGADVSFCGTVAWVGRQ